MGKNRKAAKQEASRAHADYEDEFEGGAEVPTEFLTSDDFQVVHKKRHHSTKKASPEEHSQEGFNTLPRSRSNSELIADDSQGCHSGFWTVRSHQNLASDGDLDINGSHHQHVLRAGHSSGCLSAPEKESSIASENGLHLDGENYTSSASCGPSPMDASSDARSEENGTSLAPNCHMTELASKADDKAIVNGHDPVTVAGRNGMGSGGDIRIGAAALSEEHTVKSTAQKKKDKKARDKQKKVGTCPSRNRMDSRNSESQVLVSSSSSDFEMVSNIENNNGEAKKSDDVAKKVVVGDRKRPGKKQLAVIHDAIRRAKEDEERRRQEEETRKRQVEEAERLEQERLRLEQEKKERRKLKEKQKREKMRAEGKLLSKSQKQSRARMEATLEAFRQQGVDVPQIGEKRPRGPRLGNYKPPNRKRLDSSQSDSCVGKAERHKSESLSSQESSGKESLSDYPSSFESKDSWDMNPSLDVALESEGHFSCSEESDALCEDHPSRSAEGVSSAKLKNSVEKANLSKLKDVHPEEKKDAIRLRSPVICVLGHVDTGKTKLLDYIRRTHVQDSEAGGITQQIGATMIPQDALKEKCKMVKDFSSFEIKVPGLLVIDTPGHESFRNLRSRGSSICDIAILVVDIMHGLEPQTLESINLLKTDKIPFVVALNKIDRLFGWESAKGEDDIESSVAKQSPATLMEFKKRCQEIVLQFANECLNATLYYENKDPRSYVSMVPCSAVTGDGMGNLLSLIAQLTQSMMHRKLVFSQELQATVLEVKAISGLGTTIDVILVNGRLQEGDTVVLASQDGPFVTQIRSLLMPQPLKELRVKNPYIEYKSVEGAQGLKITGKDLDKTVAGLPILVANQTNKVDQLKSKLTDLLEQSVNYIKTSERGVYVQASTLGSLEALLEYLTTSGVPYFGVKIGPVVKKDVMKASIMLEHDVQYAAILAFDVKVERDAQELADSLGVKIFHANIIYHLIDEFTLYRDEMQKKRGQASKDFIYPCILKVLPKDPAYNPKDHLRVHVEAGTLCEGTPLCMPSKGNLEVGVVTTVEGHFCLAAEGEEALIGLGVPPGGTLRSFGVDFDEGDYMVSRISKQSIEVCKAYYRDELSPEDWQLINALKKMLHIHV